MVADVGPALDLGGVSIDWLCGGHFELDGGTMFGAVPKILWQKKCPADTNNYVKLPNSPLLVRTPGINCIIDSGIGNKLTAKQQQIFLVYRAWDLPGELARFGLTREDINLVILTHCDFDHAGGIVMHGDRGEPQLTFPNARHVIQKKEWEDVLHPNIRSVHAYWPENFTGLAQSHLLHLVDEEEQLHPRIRVVRTGGHTRGHQLIEISGSRHGAVHLGDLLPSHAHSNPLWISSYDNFPLEAVEQKQHFLDLYRKSDFFFTFYHDFLMQACRFDPNGEPISSLAP
ncbi:MAG: MBL fold metallo-hydrolase [Desulfobulbaceae bacterium]|nr:MBL fold metallo-hydrolase [Desulfobulbaceae bacterium]